MGQGRTCTYDTKGDIGMSYVKNKIQKKKNQTPKLNSRLQQISDKYSEVNIKSALGVIALTS
jgi:hypothetical protein